MVRRFLNLIHREIRGLHEAAYLLGTFAILSQVLALIRDRLLAHSFGASATLDVYYAAFRIPDVLFVGVASLVSLYVLIPFLAEKAARSELEEKRFLNEVFSGFTLFIVGVSAVTFAFAPSLTALFFPGLSAGAFSHDLVNLTRLLLLQPILLGLSSLFGSVTQTRGRFMLYAFSPLFYNVGIIVGILFFYEPFGLLGLGLGVVLGAFLHLAIQLPFIIESGFFPRFVFRLNFPELKRVVLLSLPRTLSLSANQISLLFLVMFASFLTEGSITIFSFSFNLQSVPLSVIAVSYSVAAFPTLARLFSSGERGEFLAHVVIAARHIIFWSLPAVVLFIVLRAQIVRVILGSGSFDWTDTRLTAAALALFSVSLLAQGLILLFVRGYYAAGNTVRPLAVNVASAALVIMFSFLFLRLFAESALWRFFVESLFKVEGLPGTEVLMLPLGFSLASLINAGAFWLLFQKDFATFSPALARTFFQSFAASIVMGFVAYQALRIFDNVFDINTFFGIFSQGLLSGVVGILSGILMLRLLKSQELAEITESLHHKFWKVRAITPEQAEL